MKMGSNSRLVLFLQKGQTICKTLDSFYAKLMLVSFSNHIKFRVIHLRIVEPMYVISGIPKAMCFYFFFNL